MLAGISVDYVVRLEQARGPQPSEQVLTALCRALRLEPDERDHVFHLAGATPPHAGLIDLHVRPSVLRLIDRFHDLPALVMSAKSDVLAWNAMSSALHGDWSALRPERRNLARLRFLPDPTDPPRSTVGAGPEELRMTGAQTVANLRSVSGRYPDDPGLRRLLEDLHAGPRSSATSGPTATPAAGAATPRPCSTRAWACSAWSATHCTSRTPTRSWPSTPRRPGRRRPRPWPCCA